MADAAALFTLHRHRVFRYLCRAVGQPETARDLTQDVFLRVSGTTLPSGDAGALRAWIFRIARNLAIDHARRERRRPEAPLDAASPSRPASQDVSAAVNQALATLDELDRHVFLLREVAGLGYDDIATACDLTPDAVRSRIHRARLHLRSQLQAPLAECQTRPMRRNGLPS
jgi:RNA polymerase sigma-70 factor (ECF subfamily)